MEEVAADRDASVRSGLVLIGTAAVLFAADQVTKAMVVAAIPLGARIEVVGDLVQLWHVRNTGAAFSLFPGQSWLFFGVTIAAFAMIVYFFRAFRGRSPWLYAVLGAILSGTLGNLIDRIRWGYVVDFLSVGIGDLRWPTFNVADSSLVIGIGLLVLYLTFVDPRREGEAAHKSGPRPG